MDRARGTRRDLTVPLVKTMGAKTQTVVRVDATMELSTSMPMPRDRPDRVMILRERPLKYMSRRAHMTDRGMEMPTTRVGLTSLRKRARIRMASRAPRPMLRRISPTMMEI